MQYRNLTSRVALVAGILLAASNTLAAGTDAGVTVTNDVTLDYSVNGGTQPQVTTSTSFVVDSALSVLVSANDADLVSVTSGSTFAGNTGVPALSFAVTNTSNTSSNVILSVVDQDGTPVTGFATTGTGSFDADTLVLALDDGIVNGVYDDGSDTLLTLDAGGGYFTLPAALTEDQSVTVLVVIDVPAAAAADEQATYTLVAALADGANAPLDADDSGNIAPNSGAAPVSNPDDPSVQQTVFADIATTDPEDERFDFFGSTTTPNGGIAGVDTASNAQHSDSSGFIISTANLLISKYVEVLFDPISGNRYDNNGDIAPGTNVPKALPGAVLMWVIGFSNEDAVFTAESVAIGDNIEDGATAADTEPTDEGNQSGSTVNVPGEVTFDLDTGPGVVNRTFTLPAITDLDDIYVENCAGTASTQGYEAQVVLGGPDANVTADEIAVAAGDCGPGEDGFFVYFTTVNTAN